MNLDCFAFERNLGRSVWNAIISVVLVLRADSTRNCNIVVEQYVDKNRFDLMHSEEPARTYGNFSTGNRSTMLINSPSMPSMSKT